MPVDLARELSLLAMPGEKDSLEKLCQQVVIDLPNEAQMVRQGNSRLLNKLVGRVMKASRGRADAQTARATLEKLLCSTEP